MNKHHKCYVVTGLLSAVILTPLAVQSVRAATTTEPVAEQADITNWIANTPEQISANMSRQNINLGDLNGTRYVVQWGDTLSQISAVTHISVAKLAYDNQIKNIDLIYVGQLLILNANGYVPQSYSYSGNGQGVAQTHTNLNQNQNQAKIVVSPINNANSVSSSSSSSSSSSLDSDSASDATDDSAEATDPSKADDTDSAAAAGAKESDSAASSASSASSSSSATSSDDDSDSENDTMNRKTFFKKTVEQMQQIYDDKWDEGVDLKVQYGTKGLPKNHKNYKALTLDSEVMMGEGGKKIFKHDDPKAEASALKKLTLI